VFTEIGGKVKVGMRILIGRFVWNMAYITERKDKLKTACSKRL